MADNVVGTPRKGEASPAIVVNEMALKGSVHVDGNNCNEEDNNYQTVHFTLTTFL